MAGRILSDEQVQWCVEQYRSGKTSTWIAKELAINDETVRKWLKRSGEKMRESRLAMAAPVNERFFEIIDTEPKAYWLGYLLADACIGKSVGERRSLRFYVAAKDKWAIETFATDIEYGGSIRLPDKSRGQYGICFNSKKLCGDLINHGYLDWKVSGSSRILDSIPVELFHHFVRGFFDGDGSISYQKRKNRKIGLCFSFTIVAHLDHQSAMQELHDRLILAIDLRPKGVKIRQTCCAIGWNGNKQVARFGDWLYTDATRFLQRKRDRFLSLDHHRGAFDFDKLVIKEVGIDVYGPFLDSYHYLGCGGRRGYTLGLFINDSLIGAAVIGSITRAEIARKQGLDTSEVRELARFCIHPEYHFKNIPTWFLSRIVKRYKQEHPNVKMLISFADPTRGHEGTIYKAANWVFDGFTYPSYNYIDVNGVETHKKTVYGIAKRSGMTERQYAEQQCLTKVAHKRKRRFLIRLR